ncbi:MAG: hypothetical protein Ct9H90mP27_7700 [Gammaproteobacteria bacterium]|nr:MAG: hypothetical protein Ct9H90mP27_7700 [Gammaproteobacteria bacterium]
MGVKEIYIEDLTEQFVSEYVFSPKLRAKTGYEGEYLLGTSIARPLIAKRLVRSQKRLERKQFRTERQVKEMIK